MDTPVSWVQFNLTLLFYWMPLLLSPAQLHSSCCYYSLLWKRQEQCVLVSKSHVSGSLHSLPMGASCILSVMYSITVPWPVNLNSDFPVGEVSCCFLPSGKPVFSSKKVWIRSVKELIMFSECFMTCYYAQTNKKLIVEMFSSASPCSTDSKI